MRYVLRRAWRNLVRTPGRSLLLGIVLFVIAVLVMVGLSIQAGTKDGIAEARRSLGNAVTLQPNFQEIQRKLMGSGSLQSGRITKPDVAQVTESVAKKLTGSKYITDYNYEINQSACADINPVQSQDSSGGFMLRGGNQGGKTPTFRLIGDSNPQLQSDFTSGDNKIASGRFYTQAESKSGAAVAVISQMVADQNKLKVGSTFNIQSRNSDLSVEVKVIGIYQETKQQDYNAPAIALGTNQIYLPFNLARKLGTSGMDLPSDYISSAIYYLDDPGHADAFKAEAKSLGLDLGKYSLDANDNILDRLVGPMQKLADAARIGVWAVVAAGAVIMILLMTLITRERKYEVGILRSLGAGRGSVAAQFAIEALIVCLLALSAGGLVGGAVAQQASDQLLQREVAVQAQIDQQQRPFFPGGNGMAILGNNRGSIGNSNVQAIDHIQAVVGTRQAGELLLAGMLLILCGSLVSTYWIMKYEPMSILSGRS